MMVVGSTLASGPAYGALVKLSSKPCKKFYRTYAVVSLHPSDGVTSMDFTFTYDPAVLTPTGLYRTPLTTQYALSYDIASPGVVTAHLSGSSPLSGSGDVVWVGFDPIGDVGTSSALTWTSSSLNGGAIASQTVNGSLGIVTPQTFISAPPGAQGDPGAMVPVLVSATAFTGGDSFDLDLEFDPGVVTATSVERTPLTQGLSLTYNVSVPGIIRIALFGVQAINGPGDLVKIWFHVTGPLGSQTPIDITRGNINEGGIPTTLGPGFFTVCHTADADGDTFSGCAGDCNDADPSVHPGAPDAICDGVDEDCDGSADEGFVSQPTTCGTGACAASGATSCVAGVFHDSCAPGTPSPESCNGIDDDCNGAPDDVAVPAVVAGVTIAPPAASAVIGWTALATASTYDVARGRLSVLASSGGGFNLATEACLANDLSGVSLSDAGLPSAGDGFWYLVRGSNCGGAGSYDSGAPSQVGSRDAEIQAAPSHCP